MKRIWGVCLAAVVTLTGCDLAQIALPKTEVAPDLLQQIDQVPANDRTLLSVFRVNTNIGTRMFEISRNGAIQTFFSANRRGLTLQNGFVIRTQGLGQDLVAMGHSTLNVRATDVVHTRVHKYMDPENQIVSEVFKCERETGTPAFFGAEAQRRYLQPIEENCSGVQNRFTNVYFTEPGTRQIVRSRQWISPQIGYLSLSTD